MNILLNLAINSTDCLQFITDVEDSNFINLYNTEFTIWLKNTQKALKINGFAVGHDLYDFLEQIQNCINNESTIPLDLEKNVDLGLLWNEHNQKIIKAEEARKPFKSWKWTGDKLIFFGNAIDRFNSSITFLYNDDLNNIIIEVCSAYPWFFGEAPSADLYVSYDDWLSEYKIVYKSIVSKDVAKHWILQLKILHKKLDANMSFDR